jgi:hypothetical protein
LVLDTLHAEIPGVPLLVAEFGIGTDDDTLRADYLRRGLDITHAAIARGVDVRGFFHRTAVDNCEWLDELQHEVWDHRSRSQCPDERSSLAAASILGVRRGVVASVA